MKYPLASGVALGEYQEGMRPALPTRPGRRAATHLRAFLFPILLTLPGCFAVVTGPLQTTGEALDRLDAQIVKACADLDDPVNTARIDALALLSSSTKEIADIRARRERYCEVFAE